MNRFVVLRSNISGVWAGRLVASTGNARTLADARRVYSWKGRLSCSELALRGPGDGSRVCAAVVQVEIDRAPGDEMIDMSAESVDAFKAQPVAT